MINVILLKLIKFYSSMNGNDPVLLNKYLLLTQETVLPTSQVVVGRVKGSHPKFHQRGSCMSQLESLRVSPGGPSLERGGAVSQRKVSADTSEDPSHQCEALLKLGSVFPNSSWVCATCFTFLLRRAPSGIN